MAISSRTDFVAWVLPGLLGSAAVLAETPLAPSGMAGEHAPLYSPQDAWQLAHAPQSWMVDETTCERVEGAYHVAPDGSRQVLAGQHGALFREGSRRPFMRVVTREDGVYVARFAAQPNEVIVARAYFVDPRTKRYAYGAPTESVCRAGEVSVSELVPVSEEASNDEEQQATVP